MVVFSNLLDLYFLLGKNNKLAAMQPWKIHKKSNKIQKNMNPTFKIHI
jgi:hypothetical protein